MPAKKTAESPALTMLNLYTAINEQLGNFKEQHTDIFEEIARLEDQLRVAEENLKSAVRETGEPIKNARFMVKPAASFKKWLDWATVKTTAKKDELETIEARAVKSVDLDMKVMQELVMEGKIRPELVQTAYKEQQLTTRITIVPIQ